MEPFITDDIFAAYLKCETKAHLIAIDTPLPPHHIHDWQVRLAADYKTESAHSADRAVPVRFPGLDRASEVAHQLLQDWGKLRAVRSILALGGFCRFLSSVIWP